MKYPDHPIDRLKYFFWRIYGPLHPYVRDTADRLHIVRHRGRQNFLLGRMANGVTVESLVAYLLTQGYAHVGVAWLDEGEVASMRYTESFRRQYHIRIFIDGEIRGHYEYTPEYYPIYHLFDVGFEDRSAYFFDMLGAHIVPIEI